MRNPASARRSTPPKLAAEVLTFESKRWRGSLVIMLITPPMASEPYRAEDAPLTTSTRSKRFVD